MHSNASVFTVKARRSTGEVFWAGLHKGKQVSGKGWPSREAWDMVFEISRLGLVKPKEIELD
jgi:hypothetical protein